MCNENQRTKLRITHYVLRFTFVIQCVCLNPVYQKTLTIEHFCLNAVNRTKPEVVESAAGKGVNVARVLKTPGQHSVITGFIDGDTGNTIEKFLSQEDLTYDFVHTMNTTKTCITILEPVNHTQTELVEEEKPTAPEEIREMYQVYERNLQGCRMVTISGTAPSQVPDDIVFQKYTCNTSTPLSVTVMLSGVEINQDKLDAAFQQPVNSPEALANAIREMHANGIEWVVITRGKESVVVSHWGDSWRLFPPSIHVVNPICSGDAFLAGIASTLSENRMPPGLFASEQPVVRQMP